MRRVQRVVQKNSERKEYAARKVNLSMGETNTSEKSILLVLFDAHDHNIHNCRSSLALT